MPATNHNDQRVLVLAPLGRDGPVTAALLRERGLAAEVCADAADAGRQMAAGAGALLMTEEALEQPGVSELFAQLHAQPPWSELPLIILTRGGESRLSRLVDVAAQAPGGATLLERPLGANTLLRAIEVALRSRRRQYRVRDLLDQLSQQTAALRESEERYRHLFEAMHEGFSIQELITDDQGQPCDYRFLSLNPAFERLTGIQCERAIGKRVREIIPNLEPVWIERYGQVVQTGEPVRFENYAAVLGRWYEVFAYRNAPGQFAVIFTDITARKQAEAEVTRTTELLETLLATAPLGFCHLDRDLRFVRINERLAAMNGIPVADHLGKTVAEVVPALVPAVQDVTSRILATGEAVVGHEFSGETPAQPGMTRHWSECWYPVRDASGAITGFGTIVEEITDRKAAEEKLREANERFELVLAGAGGAIWDWDVLHHRVLYSPRWKALRGFAEHEVSDAVAEWSRNIHPEDAPRVMAAVHAHFEGETQVFVAEYRVRRKDGSWLWIADRGLARRDANGRVIRMAGSEVEITERKEAEQALRESESRFRQVTETLPQLVWSCAPDGPCDYLSPQWVRYTGKSEAEQLGYGWLEQLHPDDREQVIDHWRATAAQGENFEVEFRIRRHDGAYRWFRTLAVPLRDEAGNVIKWFGSNTDIDDMKCAEASLLQSREDLDRAQEVGQIGWWRLHTRSKVLTWSDENHRIFGVPQGTPLTYETFLSIVHPDDRQYVDTQWNISLRGEPYDIEHRIVVDGQVKCVREKAYLEFDEAGNLVGGFGITQDITQRMAEQTSKIHRQSVYHRSLIEASLDPLVTLGPDGKITDVNAATERVTGRHRGELLGTDFSDYFTEPEKAKSGYEQVFREGLVRDYPLEIRHADGRTTPVTYNATVYRTEAGGIAGVLATARDISERRRAERRVQAERQRFYDLLERLPLYVALVSPDHTVPFANRFFRERFGESHVRCCFELLSEHTEPCESCETHKVLKTGLPHHWEWTGPDGRDYDVDDFPFVDTDGSTLILEVGIDITERKRAQAALQAERHRLYEVLESLPALICLLTPDRRVAFANRGFRERFGAPQDRHCYECCFGKNEPCEFCETYDVLKTGRPHRWEVVSPDGRGVIDVYDFPFTDADGSPMILEMGIDITERRQAEADARRMRDELARVDRVARMGELTASLAHEINQPLAAILSNAQAARRFLASGPPDLNEIRDILDDIIQDDKRAGSVVHRLRLMLQKGKHEAETFDVNNVVREVVQFLHSEILGRNAALSTDLAPDLPAVHAGRVEVQQVMVNLLLNALDALKDVPGESRSILVRTSMEEDAVVVAVRDRGCGIHAQDLGGVFEPFFTTKPAGLGMGLAICRRIVQAYGGRIWAARNEDTGATVSFSLPCAQARQEPNDG